MVEGAQRLMQKIGKPFGYPAQSGGPKAITVVGPKHAKSDLAQAHGLFEHSVEHRREIAGRTVDDLQYLGGRGLLLQSLPRLGNEPRVLHRDHRLRGEILQQRDLLVAERPYLLAVNNHCAKQNVIFKKCHCNLASNAPQICPLSHYRESTINFFFSDIGDMDDSLAALDLGQRRAWIWLNGTGLPRPLDVARLTPGRGKV